MPLACKVIVYKVIICTKSHGELEIDHQNLRLKYHNRHSSESIRVTNLSFCQNDPPMSKYIILTEEEAGHSYTFWTMPIMIFSPASNFGDQSLLLKVSSSQKQFLMACRNPNNQQNILQISALVSKIGQTKK